MRRQKDHQFSLCIAFDRAPEEDTQHGDVAQQGDFRHILCLRGLHQAAQNNRLPIRRNGDGAGGTNINYRGIDPLGNRDGGRGIDGRDLRGHDHLDQAVGGDEGSYGKNHADILIADCINRCAI